MSSFREVQEYRESNVCFIQNFWVITLSWHSRHWNYPKSSMSFESQVLLNPSHNLKTWISIHNSLIVSISNHLFNNHWNPFNERLGETGCVNITPCLKSLQPNSDKAVKPNHSSPGQQRLHLSCEQGWWVCIGQDSTKLSKDMSKRLFRNLEIFTKDSPFLGSRPEGLRGCYYSSISPYHSETVSCHNITTQASSLPNLHF